MDQNVAQLAASAAIKMANGALMTIEEVGARLSISPMTVHRMPLPSIRLGRSLRFDPNDVAMLIALSREETAEHPIGNGSRDMPGGHVMGPDWTGSAGCGNSDDAGARAVSGSQRDTRPDASSVASRGCMEGQIPGALPSQDRLCTFE